MRTLVFSDVHGNLPALEILLKKEKADLYISLGDVVNYGPWSNECVDLLETINCVKLRGNHENIFTSGVCCEDGLVRKFFNVCYPGFTKQYIIETYLSSCRKFGLTFEHNEYFDYQIVYPNTLVELHQNCVMGHSHHPSVHENNGYVMYVVGSVGQNRAFINLIDYAIIEDDSVDLKNIVYDENLIINEMKARHYPQELIDYYNNKPRCTTL